MEKRYKLPEENHEPNEVNEPAIEYNYQRETDMVCSPPLTEEELNESMTTEEFKEYWFKCIDEVFKK